MSHKNLHPVHSVHDGMINTASGFVVDLLNPKPETIKLYDIAKWLSNICRFGGQLNNFQSVAKHTLLVWYMVPEHLKTVALLHDASEAYVGDVKKPLKVLLSCIYSPIEQAFNEVIFSKYKLDIDQLATIKPYDMAAVDMENRYHHDIDIEFVTIFKYIDQLLIEGNPFNQLLDLYTRKFGQYEY